MRWKRKGGTREGRGAQASQPQIDGIQVHIGQRYVITKVLLSRVSERVDLARVNEDQKRDGAGAGGGVLFRQGSRKF